MKSRRSLGQSMTWPIFAPGTRCAMFSEGVHLHSIASIYPVAVFLKLGSERRKCVMREEFYLRS